MYLPEKQTLILYIPKTFDSSFQELNMYILGKSISANALLYYNIASLEAHNKFIFAFA